MTEITQTITTYTGTTPNKATQTPTEFSAAADEMVDFIEGLPSELNTFGSQANSLRAEVNTAKTDAETAKTSAEAAQTAAEAAANATEWLIGSTYSDGDVVWGSNHLSYRSAQDSNTGHDPVSDDGTWWVKMASQPGANSDITSLTALTELYINGNPVYAANYNDIGTMGLQGAGVGICPNLPSGMTQLPGTETPGHDNWGNYQFKEGSITCYIPPHWIKIGNGVNGFDVNVFSVLKYSSFADEATANLAGYFLPRGHIDGGKRGLGCFVDKYQCSKNAYGTGYVASSIKNGLPLSTASTHNPIADLTACAGNYYYEAINAAKARDGENGNVSADPQWFPCSPFIYANLAMISMAHGQAATSTTYCAWYDSTGVTNYPKGNNNNALGDTDDASIAYVSDGYPNCGKTGSGTPFAKTTHNGQNCGVADLNGNMYEINIGVTSDGTKYYVAGESTAMKDFTSGNSGATDHWGATGIAATMTEVSIPYMAASAWKYMGSGTNQVLSEDLTGNGALLRSLGIPKDSDGYSATGTNQFGKDGMYNHQLQNELCVRSGGSWDNSSAAGVWASRWATVRSSSYASVSFRLACFPV